MNNPRAPQHMITDIAYFKANYYLNTITLVLLIVASILMYSANHYYVQGAMVETGDTVCLNDGDGPCGPEVVEDVRNLDVPDWVKFFQSSNGWMPPFAFLLLNVYLFFKYDLKRNANN